MCSPFKNYFERTAHGQNTRNNNLSVKVPKMKTEFGGKSFSVTVTSTYNNIPISARKLDSRVLFREHVNNLM